MLSAEMAWLRFEGNEKEKLRKVEKRSETESKRKATIRICAAWRGSDKELHSPATNRPDTAQIKKGG